MNALRTTTKERARGRWQTILPRIGIDASHLNGKNGPAPSAGARTGSGSSTAAARSATVCGSAINAARPRARRSSS